MTPVDPAREKVERADEVVRELQGAVIDDPTVFVKAAGLGGLMLIEMAKLAQSKSRDPKVGAIAARVRASQQGMLAELRKVAGRKRLDVPTALVHQDEQVLQRAPADPGAEFDDWFLRQTNGEYLKAIALYEAAAKMKDAELAAFAQQALATLEGDQKAVTAP
jgi:putative membrane protein